MDTAEIEKRERKAFVLGCKKRKEMYARKGIKVSDEQIRKETRTILNKIERKKSSAIYKN